MSEARKNSVSQLAELYNVVVGVALSISIYNVIDQNAKAIPLHLDYVTNLASILVLMIPFYHGAMRHLFATYVEDGGSTRIKDGALLADFVLLFLEGCLFVMIGSLISSTTKMMWVIVTLLLLDSVWGFLAWLAFTGAQAQQAERKWAYINVGAAAVVIVIMIFAGDVIRNNPLGAQLGLLTVLTVRSIIDYASSWNFYFPPEGSQPVQN
jgi:hypothetical protein